ncbi:hypothetical protein TWF106_004533 [Orbilia oligospora]|uniref:Uncharacterized protein n=1 Tax=Orbilia oligospora TaxID=2813651 RepID=A0A6G1MFB1_ORBOL|nr:hypothetical protein TWF788_008351 [Orbilia oligospora]KAF3198599.1 hypothetical protein TWF106_004533 [Orbilia oligospora]KAF3208763.1 hypothetical protein TWF679_007589 [Orbilia oligospora]KAF3225773.1 hypothetical protein TWF191_005120 [Orbilia oligospora]KAF3254856.1 hypothetical protein TWF192_002939 [Orbilia oligospora]
MATMISTQPRHVLTPLSPRKRTVLGNVTNIVRGIDATFDGKGFSVGKKPLGLSTSSGKRPFYTIYDENAPVNASTQTKRMKSLLSSASCDENSVPKYALVTKPAVPSHSAAPVVSKKKTVNASSSTSSSSSSSLKRRSLAPSTTSSTSSTTSSSRPALSRKDSLATLSSPSKGIKRKIQKAVRRVDPPSHLSKSGKDIESSIDGRLIATPVAKSGNTAGNAWRPGQSFPKGWMFEIHEDTLEETLTNLMYHGAGTLDISDEEDLKKCSELDRIGKENIPPPPTEDQIAMPPPALPRREEFEIMDEERIRSPLGEADVEIFYPALKKEREEAEKLKKMKQEEKRSCLASSKFAVIGNIVEDYLKQQKDNIDVLTAAAVPLPADDEEDEENLREEASPKKTETVKPTVNVPTICIENCDFDDAIDSQSRSLAEDELFSDDL